MMVIAVSSAGTLRADDNGSSALVNPGPGSAVSPDPLAEVNNAIAQNPTDAENFIIRGNIYCGQKMWGAAQDSYEQALALAPQKLAIKMDLAELQFRQKQYDRARTDFALMATDKELGDLASYMVFLCDLFGNREDAASKELAAFNATGDEPSYYFGNVAWDIVHHNVAGARDYLNSAEHIYNPGKAKLYAANLLELGYLPLKD